ncbi:MAG: leucine-rich repeat domain-containing protein [Clostridia bacterium]|nr:leucine-rich repeat domain-containing protein [Clostridia bacterium]
MKKLLAIMLAALLIFAMIGCSKQEENDDTADGEENAEVSETNVYEDFKYGVNEDGELEITGYTYTGEKLTDVTVPAEIEGRPIVGIGNDAFKAQKNIASIKFPDSILYIGDFAFSQCEYLTEITLPKNLTTIGTGAFKDCTKLENITFPASLLAIGEGAFKNCIALDSLVLPEGLLTIDSAAFWGCSALTNVTIPASIIDLGDGAFYLCTSLVEVNLLGDVATADDEILNKMNAAIAAYEGDAPETLADASAILADAGFHLGALSDKGAKYVWDTDKIYGTFSKADEATLSAINAAIENSDCDSLDEIELVLKAAGLSLNNLNASISSDKFVWDADKKAFTTVYFGESVFEGCTGNTIISVTEGTFFAEAARAKGYITIVPTTAPEGTKIFSNNAISFYYPEAWVMNVYSEDSFTSVTFECEATETLVEMVATERNLEDDHTLWGVEKIDELLADAASEITITNKAIQHTANPNGITITKMSCTVSEGEYVADTTIYFLTVGNTTYTIVMGEATANAELHTMIENSLTDIR